MSTSAVEHTAGTTDFQTRAGVVAAGDGRMAEKMAAGSPALQLYEYVTGEKLVPGTLNVELPEEIAMPAYAQEITREDASGTTTILIVPAMVNGLLGYIVRSRQAEDGNGRHSRRVVEVISSHELRRELQLDDGDTVNLRF